MKYLILVLVLSGCDGRESMYCIKIAMSTDNGRPALNYDQAREACGVKKESK